MELKDLLGKAYKEGMTAEEIAAALKPRELVDKSALEGLVPKSEAQRLAAEAEKYKKLLGDRQTDEEKRESELSEMRAELDALRLKSTISEHKARLLGLRYSEELAASTAEAMVKGDTETVYKNQALHMETMLKAQKAEALAGMTPPPAGNAEPNTDGTALAASLGKLAAEANTRAGEALKHFM